MSDEEKSEKNEMTFLGHLEVFRQHLIRAVIAILAFAILAFIYKHIIFDNIIFAPRESWFPTNRFLCYLSRAWGMESLCINQVKFTLMNVDIGGQFSMHVMVSFIAGIILAFPFIIWEVWRFIKPALTEREIRSSSGMVFFITLLFLTGVAFGYFIIIPLTVHFFATYEISEQVVNQINIKSFISMVSSVSLFSGLIFELPILIYFLSKLGMVGPAFLRKYRKHAIVLIFLIAAIITPPDVFSQLLVSIPLILLYEISIIISSRVKRKAEMKETN